MGLDLHIVAVLPSEDRSASFIELFSWTTSLGASVGVLVCGGVPVEFAARAGPAAPIEAVGFAVHTGGLLDVAAEIDAPKSAVTKAPSDEPNASWDVRTPMTAMAGVCARVLGTNALHGTIQYKRIRSSRRTSSRSNTAFTASAGVRPHFPHL